MSDFTDQEKLRLNEVNSDLNRGAYAFLNESDSVLKDQKVRKAIQQGVDVEAIRKNLNGMTALKIYRYLTDF